MSAKQDIWMPLYIADYLADTTRLNTEQHGAYLLLIMDYWRNGAPPNDDDVLANITRLSIAQWRKHKPTLLRLFVLNDGFLTHKRIEDELLKASENADKYAERAKKAAAKRWNKESSSNATSIPSSNSKAELGDMLADATSPSPSSTNESSKVSENCNLVPKTHTQTKIGLIAKGLQEIGLMPFNPSLPDFITAVEAGATAEEFVNTALEYKGNASKFNFKYVLSVVVKRRQEVAQGLHKGAMPAMTSREAGRQAAANSIFTPENTQHLQGVQIKTIYEVDYDQPAITA